MSPPHPKKMLAAAPPSPRRAVYESNPKHLAPWQRGRKGSLCTLDDAAQAPQLLGRGILDGKKIYATDGRRAFAGEEHSPGRWHGWPVGWKEVPQRVRHQLQKNCRVKRSDVRKHWHDHHKEP